MWIFPRAKIGYFGLSYLRGKTSSSVDSRGITGDDDEPQQGGGTARYMAPALIDTTLQQDYPRNVYSVGTVLNEIVTEEEPYNDQV